jgi:hypothetical protein
MLTYVKIEHIYEVRVKSNNLLIGEFILDIDGYYYFFPIENGGSWNSHTLITLGTKLQELNKPWDDKLKEYFKQETNANTIHRS